MLGLSGSGCSILKVGPHTISCCHPDMAMDIESSSVQYDIVHRINGILQYNTGNVL